MPSSQVEKSGEAVPAAADGEGKLALRRDADGLGDILGTSRSDDGGRPAVHHAVPDPAQTVIIAMVAVDDRPLKPRAIEIEGQQGRIHFVIPPDSLRA